MSDHPLYKSFCNGVLTFREKWFVVPEFKWIIYGLIDDLLRTADLEVYFKLLIAFQTLNQEKAKGNHAQLITEECFVDYPPIKNFFSACCGNPVYGDFVYTQVNTFGDKPANVHFRYALMSTELPELIQQYLTFDIAEENTGIDNVEEEEDEEEKKADRLFVRDLFMTEGIPLVYFDSEEDDNDRESIGLDYVFVVSTNFRKELKKYLRLKNRGRRLCFVSNTEGNFVDHSDVLNESNGEVNHWMCFHALIKNPMLVRPENSRRDIFRNYFNENVDDLSKVL